MYSCVHVHIVSLPIRYSSSRVETSVQWLRSPPYSKQEHSWAGSQTGTWEGTRAGSQQIYGLRAPLNLLSFFPFHFVTPPCGILHSILYASPSSPPFTLPSPLSLHSSQATLHRPFALFICLLMCWENKGICFCVTQDKTYDRAVRRRACVHGVYQLTKVHLLCISC